MNMTVGSRDTLEKGSLMVEGGNNSRGKQPQRS
jgi:hypothetical protein